jgi:hypothetical protein
VPRLLPLRATCEGSRPCVCLARVPTGEAWPGADVLVLPPIRRDAHLSDVLDLLRRRASGDDRRARRRARPPPPGTEATSLEDRAGAARASTGSAHLGVYEPPLVLGDHPGSMASKRGPSPWSGPCGLAWEKCLTVHVCGCSLTVADGAAPQQPSQGRTVMSNAADFAWPDQRSFGKATGRDAGRADTGALTSPCGSVAGRHRGQGR